MSDDNQVLIPESFLDLFKDSRGRLISDRLTVGARYELCEDMAHLLMDHCRGLQARLDLGEADVLLKCRDGLRATRDTFEPQEVEWVVGRTAELLGWNVRIGARPDG